MKLFLRDFAFRPQREMRLERREMIDGNDNDNADADEGNGEVEVDGSD